MTRNTKTKSCHSERSRYSDVVEESVVPATQAGNQWLTPLATIPSPLTGEGKGEGVTLELQSGHYCRLPCCAHSFSPLMGENRREGESLALRPVRQARLHVPLASFLWSLPPLRACPEYPPREGRLRWGVKPRPTSRALPQPYTNPCLNRKQKESQICL
jgi:hypothetical protein